MSTLTYLKNVYEISRRTKEHLWQFNINTLESTLSTSGSETSK